MQSRSPRSSFDPVKRVGTYCILIAWSVICAFPLYWVGITSIKNTDQIDGGPTYIPFWDFLPSLDAWRFILFDAAENLVSRAVNSMIIAVCSTLATLLLGGMAVYGITRFTHRFSSFALMSMILSTRILPPVVMALPLYVLAQRTGTFDSLSALIFIYTAINLPIAIWMLAPVFGPRATEQEEAANLDGASYFHIFFFILVPMIKTSVIAVGLLVFIQCWNEYLFAVYLTSDHALTIPPWMVGQLSIKEAQTGGGAEELAHLAAATVVMALPVLLLTIFAQRSLTGVLRAGARHKTS